MLVYSANPCTWHHTYQINAAEPDECTCRYRCHQYCSAEQMWTVGVGLCTETTSCCAHLSCLACLSISGYYWHCGWSSCWISNMCAAQWPSLRSNYRRRLAGVRCAFVRDIVWFLDTTYCFKFVKTAAKNPRIRTNCGKVRGFRCKLRIRNNTKTKSSIAEILNGNPEYLGDFITQGHAHFSFGCFYGGP